MTRQYTRKPVALPSDDRASTPPHMHLELTLDRGRLIVLHIPYELSQAEREQIKAFVDLVPSKADDGPDAAHAAGAGG